MSEWSSYSLSDFLLFSPQTFYRLFELYNAAVWPAQVGAVLLGVALLALLRLSRPWQGSTIVAILSALWLWVAWAYLYTRYASINWAAPYFAIGFVAQALILIWCGVVKDGLSFRRWQDPGAWAGFGILLFAILGQPMIGPLTGRPWSQIEIFGLTPDPTVTGTLGILLAADRIRFSLLLLPLLWCLISGATAWTMSAEDAWLMPAVAALGLALGIAKSWPRTSKPSPAWPRRETQDRC